jgi:hypothetical protein
MNRLILAFALLCLPAVVVGAFPLTPSASHPWSQTALHFADTDPYGSNGQWQHLAWQITGDARHLRAAVHTLKRFPLTPASRNDTREDSIEFALLYQWLKPHMTAAEREAFEGKLHY